MIYVLCISISLSVLKFIKVIKIGIDSHINYKKIDGMIANN